jgi:hypothetical protein
MVWRTCETTFGHAKNLPIVFPARGASDSKQSMTIDRTHKTGFRCTLAVNRKSDSHTIRFVLLPGSAWHGQPFHAGHDTRRLQLWLGHADIKQVRKLFADFWR